ncbi:rCG25192, isoform CRA_b [Rattus norvegicus]|uniref:RCG25192, isoform CRA_b n=1 Tax=Rattus norvegicus TaxID=10116 RepID=A6I450_RAT|nr:rCG25192, isoform CRA_b [Rattus norvegicus]
MSVIFAPDWLRGKAKVNQETIQRLLEENDQLIRCIVEYQNKGRANECVQRQHKQSYKGSGVVFQGAVMSSDCMEPISCEIERCLVHGERCHSF